MFRGTFFLLALAVACLMIPHRATAFDSKASDIEKRIKLISRLGNTVDKSLTFSNSAGTRVSIGEMIAGNRPTLLIPVYFHCPKLCGIVLQSMLTTLNDLTLSLGSDYKVIALSFNSEEKADLAKERETLFRSQFHGKGSSQGWSFYVGEKQNIATLMEQVGFQYIETDGEFAHSPAVIVLTPEGRISHYFTGAEFSSADMRLALVESSAGRIGTAFDQALLFCFSYDAQHGKYTWAVFAILKVVGALTLLFFGWLYLRLAGRDWLGRAKVQTGNAS